MKKVDEKIMRMTISEAKKLLRDNFEKGTNCPCCDQFVKLYKRKINSSMAVSLIKMSVIQKRFFDESEIWIPISKIRVRSGEYAKLRYWDLIIKKELRDDEKEKGEKSSSGRWRVTKKGFMFIENRIKIPKFAMIYNGKCYGFSKETVNIYDSLGEKFDYSELMSPYTAACKKNKRVDHGR